MQASVQAIPWHGGIGAMNEETIDTLRRIQAFASYSGNWRVMRFDVEVYDAFKLIAKCIDELIERDGGEA